MSLGWNALYLNTAGSQVESNLGRMNAIAQSQVSSASSFVQQLKNFTIQGVNLSAPQFSPAASFVPFEKPTVPDAPDFSQVRFDPVFEPNTRIGPFSPPAKPGTFSARAPTVGDLTAPTPREVQSPGAAPSIEEVTLPDAPYLSLPAVPNLEELDVPPAPALDLDDLLPERPPLDYPDVYDNDYIRNAGESRAAIFDTVDGEFHKALEEHNMRNSEGGLTASRLGEMLQGGTGLPYEVENALFERSFVREDKSAQQAVHQATGQWAARGFTMPGSTLLAQVEEAERQNREARSTLNREILVQAHQQEIENLRFSVQQGIVMEGQLFDQYMRVHDASRQVADRAFSVTQAIFDASLQIVRIKLEVYQADLQAQRERIQTELARLEVYRSQLEAQRVRGELNQQKVAVFQARLEGVRASADIYRTQVQGAEAKIRAQASKVDVFDSQIQAYRAELEASKIPTEIYEANVRAEQSKVGLFESQVRAYGERIRAYSAEIDAESKKVDAEAAKASTEASIYETKTRAAVAETNGQVSQLETQAREYEARMQGYTAQLRAEEARVSGEARNFQLDIEKERQRADIELKAADQAITEMKHATSLGLEATKTGASVTAQLAGSAMSAINVSAGISQSQTSSSRHSSTYSENAEV